MPKFFQISSPRDVGQATRINPENVDPELVPEPQPEDYYSLIDESSSTESLEMWQSEVPFALAETTEVPEDAGSAPSVGKSDVPDVVATSSRSEEPSTVGDEVARATADKLQAAIKSALAMCGTDIASLPDGQLRKALAEWQLRLKGHANELEGILHAEESSSSGGPAEHAANHGGEAELRGELEGESRRLRFLPDESRVRNVQSFSPIAHSECTSVSSETQSSQRPNVEEDERCWERGRRLEARKGKKRRDEGARQIGYGKLRDGEGAGCRAGRGTHCHGVLDVLLDLGRTDTDESSKEEVFSSNCLGGILREKEVTQDSVKHASPTIPVTLSLLDRIPVCADVTVSSSSCFLDATLDPGHADTNKPSLKEPSASICSDGAKTEIPREERDIMRKHASCKAPVKLSLQDRIPISESMPASTAVRTSHCQVFLDAPREPASTNTTEIIMDEPFVNSCIDASAAGTSREVEGKMGKQASPKVPVKLSLQDRIPVPDTKTPSNASSASPCHGFVDTNLDGKRADAIEETTVVPSTTSRHEMIVKEKPGDVEELFEQQFSSKGSKAPVKLSLQDRIPIPDKMAPSNAGRASHCQLFLDIPLDPGRTDASESIIEEPHVSGTVIDNPRAVDDTSGKQVSSKASVKLSLQDRIPIPDKLMSSHTDVVQDCVCTDASETIAHETLASCCLGATVMEKLGDAEELSEQPASSKVPKLRLQDQIPISDASTCASVRVASHCHGFLDVPVDPGRVRTLVTQDIHRRETPSMQWVRTGMKVSKKTLRNAPMTVHRDHMSATSCSVPASTFSANDDDVSSTSSVPVSTFSAYDHVSSASTRTPSMCQEPESTAKIGNKLGCSPSDIGSLGERDIGRMSVGTHAGSSSSSSSMTVPLMSRNAKGSPSDRDKGRSVTDVYVSAASARVSTQSFSTLSMCTKPKSVAKCGTSPSLRNIENEAAIDHDERCTVVGGSETHGNSPIASLHNQILSVASVKGWSSSSSSSSSPRSSSRECGAPFANSSVSICSRVATPSLEESVSGTDRTQLNSVSSPELILSAPPRTRCISAACLSDDDWDFMLNW